MSINVNKLFETGLHRLPTENLVKLADQQDLLLHKVETANLVYLIQELAARVEILWEQQQSMRDDSKPF